MKEELKNKIIKIFEKDVKNFPELIKDNYIVAKEFLYKILDILSTLYIDNIIFTITSSDSLYFKIDMDNKEITLDVFYLKYDFIDNIEAVIFIYENNKLICKYYGTLINMINKI
jgi:hypothetical protein